MMRQQRGVALMTAIVLVALAAIIAVGIASTSAMSARRGAAVFSVEQSLLVAEAGEAYAVDVLTQAAQPPVTASQKWARPIPPTEMAPEISIQGRVLDLAGRFNLNSLVDSQGKPDDVAVEQFKYLLQYAKLETYWADKLVDWIDTEDAVYGQGGEESLYTAQSPPYLTANLAITSTSELMELPEFGPERFAKIADLVTALPTGTPLNPCTAPPVVLDAVISGLAKQDLQEYQNNIQQIETNRKTRCFPTKAEIEGGHDAIKAGLTARLAETSDYFRLESLVSIGSTRFALYSLLFREGSTSFRPVLRSYGTE